MQIDTITYLCGISNTIYATVCLLCGLQLCFGIFSQRRQANTYLSRILGTCLLIMFVSAVCYLLPNLLPTLDFLYRIGTSIDIVVFIGYTMMGYALYTNNEPSKVKLIALASPFVLCAILNICFPDRLTILFFVAAAVLFAYYIFFGIALQRREHLLGDIYSDPDSHSLRWMWTTIGLFVGWWVVSGVFQLLSSLLPWYNIAVFSYMAVLFLFIYAKVSNYKEPVSLATQQEMEKTCNLSPVSCNLSPVSSNLSPVSSNLSPVSCNLSPVSSNLSPARLCELMEEEQLYLNPDLTVEDVVKCLGTNTRYFSAMLHHDMHLSFAQFVNNYRVERAKELLRTTDDKVEYIGSICGFNSPQVFRRTFSAITGKTPAEWRKELSFTLKS